MGGPRGIVFKLDFPESDSFTFGLGYTSKGIYIFVSIGGHGYHLSLHRDGNAHIKYENEDKIIWRFREKWFSAGESGHDNVSQDNLEEALKGLRQVFSVEPSGKFYYLIVLDEDELLKAMKESSFMWLGKKKIQIEPTAADLSILSQGISKAVKTVMILRDYELVNVIPFLKEHGGRIRFIAVSLDGRLSVTGVDGDKLVVNRLSDPASAVSLFNLFGMVFDRVTGLRIFEYLSKFLSIVKEHYDSLNRRKNLEGKENSK